jgi:chromate transporter
MLLWKIFLVFTRVALFSWGGGPASLALMQREAVAAGWVTSAEFADAVAWGNALPGAKMAGTWGAVAAAGGTVLPTTVLMLVMVVFFFGVKDSPVVKSMLAAVRPVVIGLLLWTAYDMTLSVFAVKKIGWLGAITHRWDGCALAVAAFAILTRTSVNPVFLIVGAAVFGLVIYR